MFQLALIGAGRMGRTHLKALLHSQSVRVSAVVEPRAELAKELVAEGYVVYDSIEQLEITEDIDGFLVAAPSQLHLTLISQLLRFSLPILCEKPCGISESEAIEVKELVERSEVRLQIGYWRRFVPALVSLRQDIASNKFGDLLLVQASQWDHRPPSIAFRNSSGGILTDMGVHEVDMIQWLTGSKIQSMSRSSIMSRELNVEDEDAASLSLTLSSGTLGLITLGRFYPDADFVGIEVMGESDHARIEVLSGESGEVVQLAALRAQAEAFALGNDPNSANIDDAINALSAISNSRDKDSK